MAWAKLDDGMPTHPKMMAAGVKAFALDVAGICYSNKHSTDGFIANCTLTAVLPGLNCPKKIAEKLVEVGRWTECAGGWMIHDIHDYQPTAGYQKEISKKRAEAGRKGGSAPTQANGKQLASHLLNPVPSRPVLKDLKNTVGDFGEIYPRKDGMKWGGASRGVVDRSWLKLSDEERSAAMKGAESYAGYVSQPGAPIVAMATTWLNQRRWEQFQESRNVELQSRPVSADAPRVGGRALEFGSAEWEARLQERSERAASLTGLVS